MELLIVGAVVGVVGFLLVRATGRRREDDPNATLWGTPMWLLGGLFYMNHTADGQHQPGGLGGDGGYQHPGDFGGHDGGGSGFDGGFGGGGDIGGGP